MNLAPTGIGINQHILITLILMPHDVEQAELKVGESERLVITHQRYHLFDQHRIHEQLDQPTHLDYAYPYAP
jgi:hypothetical protein